MQQAQTNPQTFTPQALLNGLDHLKKAKKIPSFCGITQKSFEIDGHKMTIRRAPSIKSIPAFARMLKTLGELMTHTLSYEDKGNPEQITLAQIFNVGMDSDAVKTFLLTNAMPQIMKSVGDVGYTDFHYFYTMLLPGSLSVDGVDIDTEEELEELGMTPPQVSTCLMRAAEVNFYPTSGGLFTKGGEESPEPKPPEPKADQPETKAKRKKKGVIRKAGQSARTRAPRG